MWKEYFHTDWQSIYRSSWSLESSSPSLLPLFREQLPHSPALALSCADLSRHSSDSSFAFLFFQHIWMHRNHSRALGARLVGGRTAGTFASFDVRILRSAAASPSASPLPLTSAAATSPQFSTSKSPRLLSSEGSPISWPPSASAVLGSSLAEKYPLEAAEVREIRQRIIIRRHPFVTGEWLA